MEALHYIDSKQRLENECDILNVTCLSLSRMTDFHLNKSSLLGVEMLQAFMKQISDNVALISVNVTASTFSPSQS